MKSNWRHFIKLLKGVILSEDKSIKFTNIDDVGIYVEKIKGKGAYYIKYECKTTFSKLRFDTVMRVYLKNPTIVSSSQVHFRYNHFKSDLLDFLNGFDSEDD